MKTVFTIIIIITCFNISHADTVRMAFSSEIPPYVFETKKGIEYDIIKYALAESNHELEAIFMPLGRVGFSFKNSSEINAAQRDINNDLNNVGYYSSPIINYYNCIISLQESFITIKKPKDLTRYKIAAFQGAKEDSNFKNWLRYVGEDNYIELKEQLQQAYQLQSKQVDLAIADLNVIDYYNRTLKQKNILSEIKPISCKHVGKKNSGYKVVFKSKKIRDEFNSGLKNIIKQGKVNKIYDKYGTKPTSF